MAISAAELQVRIKTDGADRAKRELNDLGDTVEKTGNRSRMVGTGFLGLGAAIGGLFAYSTTEAIGFGEAMANVNSIAQLTTAELGLLGDQVVELSAATGQSADTLAAGLYDIYSSGFSGADGLMILENAANAANAGLTDTATSAKAITSVLNAYNMSADESAHVSDVLFQTVNDGVITFEQLANNLGNTLPLANAVGVSFEELAAAYARMTLAGVSGTQAETQIASLMRAAINPTEALTAAVIEFSDYATVEALIAAEGMTGYLDLLTVASGGSSEALFELLGTSEAVNAALLLGGENSAEYAAEVDKMMRSSEGLGATQTALAKQMESTAFSLKLLKTNIQAAAIAIGVQLEPVIRAVAKGMTAAIKIFLAFSKPVQQIIAGVLALVGVLAGAAGAWILFGSQISAVIALFGSLLLPIAAIVAAIAGLYFAWQTNFLGIRDITADAAGAILEFLSPVTDFLGRLKDAWDDLGAIDLGQFAEQWDGLSIGNDLGIVERAITALDVATGGLITRLRDMTAMDMVIAVGSWVFDTAVDLGSALYTWVTGLIPDGLSIGGVIVNIGNWIVNATTSIWDAITGWAFGYGADAGMSGDGTGGATPQKQITVGAIGVLIGGWIVTAATSIWDAIQDTFSFGSSGGGVGRGGGDMVVANQGGAVIEYGTVNVHVGTFDVEVDFVDLYKQIDQKFIESTTMDDSQFAEIESSGAAHGRGLMNSFISGVQAGLSLFGGSGGGGGGGGGGSNSGNESLSASFRAYAAGLFSGAGEAFNEATNGPLQNLSDGIFARLDEWAAGIEGFVWPDITISMPTFTWPDMPDIGSTPFVTDFVVMLASIADLLGSIEWSFDVGMPDMDWPNPLDLVPDDIKAFIKDPWGFIKGKADYSGTRGAAATGFVDDEVVPLEGGGEGMITQLPNTGGVPPAVIASFYELKDAILASKDAMAGLFSGDGGRDAGGGPAGAIVGITATITAEVAKWPVAIDTAAAGMGAAALNAGAAAGFGVVNGLAMAAGQIAGSLAAWPAAVNGVAPAMGSAGLNAGAVAGFGAANGIASARGSISGNVAVWPGIINGVAGSMGAAGYNAGAAAGFGVANGITSAIGAVQSAANQIAAIVATTMALRLIMNSPSKVLSDLMRKGVGPGVAQGILAGIPDVIRASEMMADAVVPLMPAYAGSGSMVAPTRSGNSGRSTGDTYVFHIAPGDHRDQMRAFLADEFIPAITQRNQQRKVALGVAS